MADGSRFKAVEDPAKKKGNSSDPREQKSAPDGSSRPEGEGGAGAFGLRDPAKTHDRLQADSLSGSQKGTNAIEGGKKQTLAVEAWSLARAQAPAVQEPSIKDLDQIVSDNANAVSSKRNGNLGMVNDLVSTFARSVADTARRRAYDPEVKQGSFKYMDNLRTLAKLDPEKANRRVPAADVTPDGKPSYLTASMQLCLLANLSFDNPREEIDVTVGGNKLSIPVVNLELALQAGANMDDSLRAAVNKKVFDKLSKILRDKDSRAKFAEDNGLTDTELAALDQRLQLAQEAKVAPPPAPAPMGGGEPGKAAPPEPGKAAVPEPGKAATPEPAKAATPEPAKAATPEPAKAATPEPAKAATPEPAKAATPATPPERNSGPLTREMVSFFAQFNSARDLDDFASRSPKDRLALQNNLNSFLSYVQSEYRGGADPKFQTEQGRKDAAAMNEITHRDNNYAKALMAKRDQLNTLFPADAPAGLRAAPGRGGGGGAGMLQDARDAAGRAAEAIGLTKPAEKPLPELDPQRLRAMGPREVYKKLNDVFKDAATFEDWPNKDDAAILSRFGSRGNAESAFNLYQDTLITYPDLPTKADTEPLDNDFAHLNYEQTKDQLKQLSVDDIKTLSDSQKIDLLKPFFNRMDGGKTDWPQLSQADKETYARVVAQKPIKTDADLAEAVQHVYDLHKQYDDAIKATIGRVTTERVPVALLEKLPPKAIVEALGKHFTSPDGKTYTNPIKAKEFDDAKKDGIASIINHCRVDTDYLAKIYDAAAKKAPKVHEEKIASSPTQYNASQSIDLAPQVIWDKYEKYKDYGTFAQLEKSGNVDLLAQAKKDFGEDPADSGFTARAYDDAMKLREDVRADYPEFAATDYKKGVRPDNYLYGLKPEEIMDRIKALPKNNTAALINAIRPLTDRQKLDLLTPYFKSFGKDWSSLEAKDKRTYASGAGRSVADVDALYKTYRDTVDRIVNKIKNDSKELNRPVSLGTILQLPAADKVRALQGHFNSYPSFVANVFTLNPMAKTKETWDEFDDLKRAGIADKLRLSVQETDRLCKGKDGYEEAQSAFDEQNEWYWKALSGIGNFYYNNPKLSFLATVAAADALTLGVSGAIAYLGRNRTAANVFWAVDVANHLGGRAAADGRFNYFRSRFRESERSKERDQNWSEKDSAFEILNTWKNKPGNTLSEADPPGDARKNFETAANSLQQYLDGLKGKYDPEVIDRLKDLPGQLRSANSTYDSPEEQILDVLYELNADLAEEKYTTGSDQKNCLDVIAKVQKAAGDAATRDKVTELLRSETKKAKELSPNARRIMRNFIKLYDKSGDPDEGVENLEEAKERIENQPTEREAKVEVFSKVMSRVEVWPGGIFDDAEDLRAHAYDISLEEIKRYRESHPFVDRDTITALRAGLSRLKPSSAGPEVTVTSENFEKGKDGKPDIKTKTETKSPKATTREIVGDILEAMCEKNTRSKAEESRIKAEAYADLRRIIGPEAIGSGKNGNWKAAAIKIDGAKGDFTRGSVRARCWREMKALADTQKDLPDKEQLNLDKELKQYEARDDRSRATDARESAEIEKARLIENHAANYLYGSQEKGLLINIPEGWDQFIKRLEKDKTLHYSHSTPEQDAAFKGFIDASKEAMRSGRYATPLEFLVDRVDPRARFIEDIKPSLGADATARTADAYERVAQAMSDHLSANRKQYTEQGAEQIRKTIIRPMDALAKKARERGVDAKKTVSAYIAGLQTRANKAWTEEHSLDKSPGAQAKELRSHELVTASLIEHCKTLGNGPTAPHGKVDWGNKDQEHRENLIEYLKEIKAAHELRPGRAIPGQERVYEASRKLLNALDGSLGSDTTVREVFADVLDTAFESGQRRNPDFARESLDWSESSKTTMVRREPGESKFEMYKFDGSKILKYNPELQDYKPMAESAPFTVVADLLEKAAREATGARANELNEAAAELRRFAEQLKNPEPEAKEEKRPKPGDPKKPEPKKSEGRQAIKAVRDWMKAGDDAGRAKAIEGKGQSLVFVLKWLSGGALAVSAWANAGGGAAGGRSRAPSPGGYEGLEL